MTFFQLLKITSTNFISNEVFLQRVLYFSRYLSHRMLEEVHVNMF